MATITTSVPSRDFTADPVQADLVPDEYTGLYPVHQPTLSGVDQLLLLDDEWVILVINNLTELRAEIDTLSGGLLETRLGLWKASVEAFSPNYGDRNNMRDTRNDYIAQARKNISELDYSTNSYYAISSADDSNYSPAVEPSLTARQYINQGPPTYGDHSRTVEYSANWTDVGGLFDQDYNIHCFVKFPTRMVDGKTYTITLDNGKTATFTYDLRYSVSRAIKVNQTGYLPSAAVKKAYLGANTYEHGVLDLSHTTTFEIINVETQQVAFNGNVVLIEANPLLGPGAKTGHEDYQMYGEDVYGIDFSAMTETGTFFIKVPGVGRSWPFKHSTDALDYAYFTAARGMLHQRAGISVDSANSNWTRSKAKMGPIYESEWVECKPDSGTMFNNPIPDLTERSNYASFKVIGYTTDFTKPTPQVAGGWHDAADWDCRAPHYNVIWDLLFAYQFNANHDDDQLGLPESGDGVPDLLSEARHGLEIWRSSQTAEGGVAGRVETNAHVNIDSWRMTKPNTTTGQDSRFYSFSQRTRWATLHFAAAAATYARLVAPFDAADASTYQAAAELAYAWGTNSANSLGVDYIVNGADNAGEGPGTFTVAITELDEYIYQYELFAKLCLYLLTTDAPTYLVNIEFLLSQTPPNTPGGGPYSDKYSYGGWGQYLFYSLIQVSETSGLYTTERAKAESEFIAEAEFLYGKLANNPYPLTWERSHDFFMAYGGSHPENRNRCLLLTYEITGLAKYKDTALQNLDFSLGCNPLGLSYMTGAGYVYPVNLQHAFSGSDKIIDPVPGIVIYGMTAGPIYKDFREQIWRSPVSQKSNADNGAGGVITSLTQTGGTATAITQNPHGLTTGDKIVIYGAIPGGNDRDLTGYNVAAAITYVSDTEFQFPVDSGIDATATGSPQWWHDFVDDFSQRTPPVWRRLMIHPFKNVAQCEFTIHECMGGMIFSLAYFYSGTTQTQKKPRPEYAVHGQWFLP